MNNELKKYMLIQELIQEFIYNLNDICFKLGEKIRNYEEKIEFDDLIVKLFYELDNKGKLTDLVQNEFLLIKDNEGENND